MRQRRQARPEIRHYALGHRSETDGLAPGRAADALEAFRDALQPLGVRLKMGDELAARRIRILPQVINPTREAHERGAELVRRLARHRHPEAIARRGDARTHRPYRDQNKTYEHRALQDGETRERPGGGEGAIMNRADAGLGQWRVDAVQLGDPTPPRRLAGVGVERRVIER